MITILNKININEVIVIINENFIINTINFFGVSTNLT